jgi:hypothetical protein
LESNPNAFLEWDAYFNEKRNRFIAEKTGKEDTATK